jgi:hypothetical protein
MVVKRVKQRNRENFIVTIDAPTEADGSITYEFLIENYLGFDIGVTIVTPPNDDIGTISLIIAKTDHNFSPNLQEQQFGY